MIAALFVETGGSYYGLEGVDPWDEARDARSYSGPHPVIAHPPCNRWAMPFAQMVETRYGHKVGDDGGCFSAALAAVRQWGGVLEHPANTRAWSTFGLPKPPTKGGWVPCEFGGWASHVEQNWYGHPARKATWLYVHGFKPPELKWGRVPVSRLRAVISYKMPELHPHLPRLEKSRASRTPARFRSLLIKMVKDSGLIERNRVIYG